MNVLVIGDITGKPGREAVRQLLPQLRKKEQLDFIIANGENIAGGSGITQETYKELLGAGVDVVTSGDHVWKQKQIMDFIGTEKRLLRPANYPDGTPGTGWGIFKTQAGKTIGVINVLGRVFLEPMDCPFRAVMECVKQIKTKTDIIFVDVHAEATSEKVALGRYLDGHVSCVYGTHTHVQTADEKILPNGTAYITDIGMTGPFDSVIGRKTEQILQRFLTRMPVKFEVADGDVRLDGAVITIDEKTSRATAIKRIELAKD